MFDFSEVGCAAVWGYPFFTELPALALNLHILLTVGSGFIASRQQST
jgi:hypothetical protein